MVFAAKMWYRLPNFIYMTAFEIVIAGVLSGVTSEIGGVGMLISLPMLIAFGLPPVVANGTNRIGTMMLYTFAWSEHRRHNHINYRQSLIIAIPIILGAIVGAVAASHTSQVIMQWSVVVLIVAMSIFTAFAHPVPESNQVTENPEQHLTIVKLGMLFAVGFYCGYLQSGMSFLMFYVLVKYMDTKREMANGIRHFLSMFVTPFSLVIFIIFGHINWIDGFYLAIGAAIGGWLGAVFLNYLPISLTKINIILSLVISILYLIYFFWKHWGQVYFL